MSNDFIVSRDSGLVHTVGDGECPECWATPVPCYCGGLIHSEFGDEDGDGNYYLLYLCDKCGHDWAEKE